MCINSIRLVSGYCVLNTSISVFQHWDRMQGGVGVGVGAGVGAEDGGRYAY